MKSSVDDTADDELERCDYRTAGKTADDKAFCLDLYVCYINYQQCRTARQGHRPVREASKNHLDKAVNYSARGENDKVFLELIHNITYIRITPKIKKKHPFFRCFFPFANFICHVLQGSKRPIRERRIRKIRP